MIDPRVAALCAEFGVEIVAANRYPEPRQTRAPDTLRRIIDRRGIEHARLVMTTLAETANNHACLDETGFWAASDMVTAWRRIVETRASDWLDAWDSCPVGELQWANAGLAGIVKLRDALGGQIHERLVRRFGPNADQLDLLDDRRRVA